MTTIWIRCLSVAFTCAAAVVAAAATPQLAASEKNAMALDSSGRVYSWGSDQYGQLGQGRILYSATPRPLGTRTDVKTVSAGTTHSLMLTENGDVYSWGSNTSGQLADGGTTDRSEPVKIFSNAALVAAGDLFSLVVDQAGVVWEAGLGRGNTLRMVVGAPPLVQVVTAGYNTIGLASDGSVWSWGDGQLGVLGFGNESLCICCCISKVRNIPGIPKIARLAVGYGSVMAIDVSGQVWAWGQASAIDGTSWNDHKYLPPTKLPNLTNVASIGGDLVLFSDGTISTWFPGQTIAPTAVPTTERFSTLIPHGWRGYQLAVDVLLSRSGTVWTYGRGNAYGQLGRTGLQDLGLVDVAETLTDPSRLSTNGTTVFAVGDSGRAWVWGSNTNSQFASDPTFSPVPKLVNGLPSVREIDSRGVSGCTSFAVGDDGSLWGWGVNDYQQLGLGDSTPRSSPVQVAIPSKIKSVKGGSLDTIALDADGNVWSWGYSASTIRRNGDYSRPAKVADVSNILAIAKGLYFALALRTDGTVVSWGSTYNGQVGNGTFTPDDLYNYLGPTTVTGLNNIVAISAGHAHGLALDSSGKVYGWGDNINEQLGFKSDASKTQSGRTAEPLPVLLPVPGKAVAINADAVASHILLDDGRVMVFSYASSIYAKLPRPVVLLPISYGATAGYFMDRDGMVYSVASSSWIGSNYYGQLGDGTIAQRLSPGLVVNTTADGYLDLLPSAVVQVPPELQVPFFVVALREMASTSASVGTTTKFNASDIAKPGSVFVTAMVPTGALGTAQGVHKPPGAAKRALASTPTSATTPAGFTLIQLTPTGWQTVVNGELIPYATGVLGDQLAAQTILSNTDTTNLKGAEFCVGYGTSAQDMIANGNIRAVATIPGANSTASCVVGGTLSVAMTVAPGWNLLGNPVNQTLAVSDRFGNPNLISSVWKWDTDKANWQFYSPALTAAELKSYATSQGYGVLTEINPGDGYWVNAKAQADLGTLSGSTINLRQSSLASGWNLVATASPITAQHFNLSLSTTPPTAGQVPINMTSMWAWDNARQTWYFYAPSLDQQGSTQLLDYINGAGYIDFNASGKTLGNGAGFWVRRP